MLHSPSQQESITLSLSLSSSSIHHPHTLTNTHYFLKLIDSRMKNSNIISVAVLMILVFLFISTPHTASCFLEEGSDLMIESKKPATEMENIDSFHNLMGVEECESEEDEECLKRRVLADAHLDYIYTQDHKH